MQDALQSPESKKLMEAVVVDRIGMLNALYELSDIAFVGGSLVKLGGHNPLEPASFRKPVLFGPHMTDFAKIAELLLDGGGAIQISNAASLSAHLIELLADPGKRRRLGRNALAVFETNRGAVSKALRVIETKLIEI
jgi:3-deoxy-D-manno-octulosonic-acid transferase